MKNPTIFLLVLSIFFYTIAPVSAKESAEEANLIKQVEIAKNKYGEFSNQHMQALNELESLYKDDLNYREKHKDLLTTLISRFEAKYGSHTRVMDSAISGLAEMYMADREYLKAIPYLEELAMLYELDALKVATDNNSRMRYSLKLFVVLDNLINSYVISKQFEEAQSKLNLFYNFIQTSADDVSPQKINYFTARAYDSSAEVEMARNHFDKALEYEAKCLALFEKDASLPRHEYAFFQSKYDQLSVNLKNRGGESSSKKESNNFDYIPALHYENINRGDLDGAIKVLEAHVRKLEADPNHNSFQLGHNYLQLSYDYSQKYQTLKNGDEKPTNVKDILNQAKWLDLSITLAKKSVVELQDAPHAQPQISLALFWIAFVQIANGVGDVDEVVSILHASIQSASKNGPENILAGMSQTLLSLIYAGKEKPELSIFWGKQAVNTLQSIKQTEESLSLNFKSMFEFVSRMTYEIVPTVCFIKVEVQRHNKCCKCLKSVSYTKSCGMRQMIHVKCD